MFRNLEAEQSRYGLTDNAVAEKLGISRETYLRKKKNQNFKYNEILKLCMIFRSTFEYLFCAESDNTAPRPLNH